jgi:hypothetical protein
MVKTTRKQREALLSVYRRAKQTKPYKDFRRSVMATFGCDNAVAVPWCDMWLIIETDGYTHS